MTGMNYKALTERLGDAKAALVAAGAVFAVIVAGVSWGTGQIETAFTYFSDPNPATAQISALDQRVTLLEDLRTDLEGQVEDLKAENTRLVEAKGTHDSALARLQERQRDAELKLARLDALLEAFRERNR